MHRGRQGIWGIVAVLAGVIIIFSLVLPSEFWWFMFAALLIAVGVWWMRCC